MIPSFLSIVYTTGRRDPKFEWFASSLKRELERTEIQFPVQLMIADFYAEAQRVGEGWDESDVSKRVKRFADLAAHPKIWRTIHFPPKHNLWQGPCRDTRDNWWAVSSLRNTAICRAPDGWIAFVDDLSVLRAGWLAAVADGMQGERIICGAYEKVKNMVVSPDGRLIQFENFKGGKDNRWAHGSDTAALPCGGRWMFGCSLLAPVHAFVKINGYDERCDGLSFEDCICGIHLENAGFRFAYDRRMATFESEEHHHEPGNMKRSDYGVSPNDKSHKILELATNGNGWSPNDFTPFDNLASLRTHVLSGGEFPIPDKPGVEWFTGQSLATI